MQTNEHLKTANQRSTMNTMAREMWKTDLGVVNVEVLACVLRATTKKRSSTFSGKKSAPPKIILATPRG